uniref:Uncharacterized protein n=1 Tax=Utricularia reniformis TaxID=192314 RepID=A0A1Y0AZB3_9LAMI|nr:hypothetical protein AEK19_MT0205 [Utricularia reniformis]ART30484.1 hypothetical protein AEK19_MT0205 [Utricularia reniformis]
MENPFKPTFLAFFLRDSLMTFWFQEFFGLRPRRLRGLALLLTLLPHRTYLHSEFFLQLWFSAPSRSEVALARPLRSKKGFRCSEGR